MNSREMKVAVVAPTWLGDTVMSLPLIGYLASARDVRVTVIARERPARVYFGVDGVNDLVIPKEGGRSGRIRRHREVLAKIRPDGVVILPPSFSAALGCFLAGAAVRAGVSVDARGMLLNARLSPGGLRGEHLSQNYLRLGRLVLERLGVPADHAYRAPGPRTFAGERARVLERLRAAGMGEDCAVVVPGATFGPTKAWPREKYRELVRRLSSEMPVALGGSAGERALCSFVAEGAKTALNLAGETTLGEFMALLEGSRVVVANDSGSPHLAASLGAPVVVIFGSTSPVWTAPLGEDVHVIREPVHCSPCFLKTCPTRLECYEGITVDRVLAAAIGAAKKGVEKKGVEKKGSG